MAAATRGGRTLVAAGASIDGGAPEIRVFSPDAVPSPAPRRVALFATKPALAAGPAGYLLAWVAGPFAPEVRATLLDDDGIVIDPGATLVLGPAGGDTHVALAETPEGFVAAWLDRGSLVAVEIAADGRSAGTPFVVATGVTASEPTVRLLHDGFRTLVTWTAAPNEVRAARLAPGGVIEDPAGFLVASLPSLSTVQPALASDGAGRTVVAYVAHRPLAVGQIQFDRVHVRTITSPAPPIVDAGPEPDAPIPPAADAARVDAASPGQQGDGGGCGCRASARRTASPGGLLRALMLVVLNSLAFRHPRRCSKWS